MLDSISKCLLNSLTFFLIDFFIGNQDLRQFHHSLTLLPQDSTSHTRELVEHVVPYKTSHSCSNTQIYRTRHSNVSFGRLRWNTSIKQKNVMKRLVSLKPAPLLWHIIRRESSTNYVAISVRHGVMMVIWENVSPLESNAVSKGHEIV